MEIFWLGHGCFRLRGREATIVTDPCPPSTGYKIGRLPADIVTISHDRPENSYRQAITGDPKYITGPGEYEIAGVLMTGVRTEHEPRESDHGSRNVAYVIDLDDVRVCHLGSIAKRPAVDDVGALSAADVLIIPVGGGEAMDAELAAETVSLLEPKLVIPMLYKTEAATAKLETVDKFLREMGTDSKTPEARLSVTKSNLPADTTVVLLNYRG